MTIDEQAVTFSHDDLQGLKEMFGHVGKAFQAVVDGAALLGKNLVDAFKQVFGPKPFKVDRRAIIVARDRAHAERVRAGRQMIAAHRRKRGLT